MEFWFVLGHDPLEVAFILPGESLCKVASQCELAWLSFGLEINFSRSLLVHTKHIQWTYWTCLVVKLSSLELKFVETYLIMSSDCGQRFMLFGHRLVGFSIFLPK
jgi:hypothetical protein